MRDFDPVALAFWRPFIFYLSRAAQELPVCDATVYRPGGLCRATMRHIRYPTSLPPPPS